MKVNPLFKGYNLADIVEINKMITNVFSSNGCYYDENIFPKQENMNASITQTRNALYI